MKEKYKITGMTCSACQSHVEKTVAKLSGVEKVSVNLLTNEMQVEYDENKLSSSGIEEAVKKSGYGAGRIGGSRGRAAESREETSGSENDAAAEEIKGMKKRLIWSVLFLVPLMYVAMYHMFNEWFGLPVPDIVHRYLHGTQNASVFGLAQLILVMPILYVNRKYFENGFRRLWQKAPNMDTLIAIGSAAAVIYGLAALLMIGYGLGHGNTALVERYSMDLYFESAGTILTLITLGKFLEAKSKGKTGEAIRHLMDLAPKTALVERNGAVEEVLTEEIREGDILHIKPGSSIPVDGTILEGETALDEAAITGESIPVEKTVGDTVISATMNQSGFIKIRASRVGEDTTLSQIIRLVEEASSSKAPIARLADKIAGVFVPIVIVIAVLAAAGWLIAGAGVEFALSAGIGVLVISCPCALGLATPVAIMVGTGKGAANGILIKSGEALQTLQGIQTIVIDKTGTLTEGIPKVTDVIEYMRTENDFLQVAASVENASEHPLSKAIVTEAKRKKVEILQAQEFKALFGKGVSARVNGAQYLAGNLALMQENDVAISEEQKSRMEKLAAEGKTPLIFAEEKTLIGIIAVADKVKETSREAIRQFHKLGIKTVMLTGDNKTTAMAIQKQLGMDEVVAGVLPNQKEEKIREIRSQGKMVAMIGDGINDAPALAGADVGIAIGAGTDVALESADVVLMKSDLLDAVTAVRLSRSVLRNIKQNLFWAFFYNVIGIPLAAGLLYPAFGWKLNPMFGAAAMSLSSLFVVGNALRLRFFKANQDTVGKRMGSRETENNKLERTRDIKMKKTIKIEGMSCGHCTKRVEEALQALEGMEQVTMNLEEKKADIVCGGTISEDSIRAAVTDAGYEVTEII